MSALADLLDHSEWCCASRQTQGRCVDASCQKYREGHAARLLTDRPRLLAAIDEDTP